jgi:hypothetical protein
MGFFRSLKCGTGFHDWSDWSSKSYADCSQSRTCKVSGCRGHESRTVHDWTDFAYIDSDSCEKSATCRDCSKVLKQSRTDHHWTDNDWEYVKAGSCEQSRECSRCSLVESRLRHAWDVWKEEYPGSDRLVRFCRRCVTGRQQKEPGPIYCIPTADMGWGLLCAAQIQNHTPRTEDPGHLLLSAQSLVYATQDHGCELQIGHVPSNPSSRFTYFAWDWNEDADKYDVLRWQDGYWQ